MNIVKIIDQYNDNYIYFCDPIKNNIMNDAKFIRVLYSPSFCTMNGVYLLIQLHDIVIEKYFNKYKCCFQVAHHRDMIENIKLIEDSILKKVNIQNKIPLYKIYEQLSNGNIKILDNNMSNQNMFALKISGIWETDMHYGVTFKFSRVKGVGEV